MSQTLVNPLAGPLAKVERAKKHIADLDVEMQSFFATKPYVVGTKRNSSNRLVYYVTSVQQTPTAMPIIAGDVVLNCPDFIGGS